MNTISIIGNLGKDPEIKYSQGGTAWTRFRVAVRRRFKKDDGPDTDWFSCVAFGKTAETIGEHLHKGSQVGIVGEMISNPYEDQDGNEREGWEINVSSFTFVGKKDEGGGRRDRDDEDERPRGGDRQRSGGSSSRSGPSNGGSKRRQQPQGDDEIPF